MTQKARFQVDPRLATLLGDSYRSSEQAIKESVDNAWDADAENVYITLPDPMTSDPIRIEDDGSGMTSNEVLNEYLVVANDRRSRKGERTPRKNRLVKGRKGVGKFAGLMAANTMIVESKARGFLTHLLINKEDLLSASADLEGIDLPLETTKCTQEDHGTTIILSHLNQNLSFPNPEKLKRILILEYGRQADFRIHVNDEQLSIDDIPGETFTDEIEITDVGRIRLRFTVAEGHKPLKQSGLAIRVGGKVVGKPTYLDLDQDEHIPGKLLKKIYGEIEADGLVDDITADWGAIIENSKAFDQVKTWAAMQLKEKINTVFANEVNLAKARHQKEINRRLEKIPDHRRDFARRALDRVMRRFYGESEERIGVIISVVLEAFERDEYWVVLQKIDDSKQQDVETFAEALENFGLLDMALMAQQASSRLALLDKLDDLIQNPGTLEKTIHAVFEKNLWLLGAEYSLMSSNDTLARIIEEYTNTKFKGERAHKRPDLFLSQDLYEQYLLIEFKRPSHALTRDDENQAIKYRDDLTPKFDKIIILVLGGERHKTVPSHYDREDLKVISYAALISRARTQLQWLINQLTT